MALIGVLHTAYCGSGQILSIHAVTYMPEELSIRIEYTHTTTHKVHGSIT